MRHTGYDSMMFLFERPAIHIALHFIVPLILALLFYRSKWRQAFLIMIATMLVDIDHLWADPVYAPGRCSIGFHFLHTWPLIGTYFILLLFPRTRLVAIGLLLHMALDGIDCLWMKFE